MRRGAASAAAAVGLVLVSMLAGCARAEPVTFCPASVDRIEIYNTYADHAIADYQDVTDSETIEFLCEMVWVYDSPGLEPGSPEDLDDVGSRGTTAVVLHDAEEVVKTLWFYRTVGFDDPDIIAFDSGEIYQITAHTLVYYAEPSSEVVDRSAMPQR